MTIKNAIADPSMIETMTRTQAILQRSYVISIFFDRERMNLYSLNSLYWCNILIWETSAGAQVVCTNK